MLAEFLKQSSDDTMLVDRTFCKNSDTFDLNDMTFVSEPLADETCVYPDAKEQACFDQTFTNNENASSNHTFTTFPASPAVGTDEANSSRIVSPHENLLNSTRVISAPNSLNSTRTICLNNLTASTNNHEIKTDLTFDVKSTSASPTSGGRSDATFDTCNSSAKNSPRQRVSIKFNHWQSILNILFEIATDTLCRARLKMRKVHWTGLSTLFQNYEQNYCNKFKGAPGASSTRLLLQARLLGRRLSSPTTGQIQPARPTGPNLLMLPLSVHHLCISSNLRTSRKTLMWLTMRRSKSAIQNWTALTTCNVWGKFERHLTVCANVVADKN